MKKRSLFYKFITCIVAGIVTAALWLLIGGGASHALFPKPVIFSLVGISLAGAVVVPFFWQYQQKKNLSLNEQMFGWLYTIIRGAIAFDLAIFGAKKVFQIQFIVPDTVAALPMKYINSETLTWYYFGHSFAFICIMAFIQLTGATMLLFRKTCLFGAIILFAFLLNVSLIDIFYQMNGGALTQAIVMTIGTAFLVTIDYDRLVEFFFSTQSGLRSVNIKMGMKNILRIATVLLAVLYTWYCATH